jgi:hypothetical protein
LTVAVFFQKKGPITAFLICVLSALRLYVWLFDNCYMQPFYFNQAFQLAFWAIYPFHHLLVLPFSLYDLFIPWYKSCFLRLFDLARGIQKNLVDCLLHKKRGQFGEISRGR